MQQPLERYGVVVLLFLVALVAVAVFWEDGNSTKLANESLATVEPVDERPLADELERRPASDVSRVGGDRATPKIALGPEEPGVDKRGRTTTYDVKPFDGGAAAPVEPEQIDSETAGFSRPEVRGGGQPERRLGDGVSADLANAGRGGQDTLAKDLDRARGEAAGANGTTITPVVGPQPGAPREYTVRAGESLWRIAERELGNGTRCKEIAKLNGLSNSDLITEGMKLKLPAKDGVAPAVDPVAPVLPAPSDAAPKKTSPAATTPVRRGTGDTTERLAVAPGTRRYVVKSGDSLGLIAQRELGSARRADEIKQLNKMSNDVVKLGTSLILPGAGSVSDAPVVANLTPKPATPRETTRPPGRAVPAAVSGRERRASSGEFFVR
jgi:LysM repeat protein